MELTETFKAELHSQMRMWRLGLGFSLPEAYVKLHRSVAEINAQEFAASLECRIIAREEVKDGWFDVMKVLRLVCEDSTGQLRDFRWSDANGGSWFERYPSGGQGLVRVVGEPGRF